MRRNGQRLIPRSNQLWKKQVLRIRTEDLFYADCRVPSRFSVEHLRPFPTNPIRWFCMPLLPCAECQRIRTQQPCKSRLSQGMFCTVRLEFLRKIRKVPQRQGKMDFCILIFRGEKQFSFPCDGGANRPLQGTKLLVIMAIRRSRGESMMRQPTIPAALQPKPMHMDG